MKLFTINVEKIEDNDGKPVTSGFTGSVSIEIPTYKERISLVKTMGLAELATGKADAATSVEKSLGIVDEVIKRVKSVELSHAGTATKIETMDDLGYYKEGVELINYLGRVIIGGVPLGNR